MISKNDIFLLLSFTLLFSTFLTFLSISDDFVITVDFNGIKRHHVLTAEDIIYDTNVPLLRLQKSDSSYDEYDSLLYLILGLTITLYFTSYHKYATVSKLREFLSKNISVLYDVSTTSPYITSPQRTIQLQNSKKTRVLLLSFLILFFSSIAFFEPTSSLSEAYAQVAPISASDSINTLTTIDDPSFVYTITNRTDSTKLVTPVGVTTVLINGTSYALVISQTSGGVTIINITDPTFPTTAATINDGEGDFTALTNTRDIATILIDDKPYAIVATNFDGVQIINITDPTDPTATAAVNSNGFTGASSITTVTINDKHYALVTAHLFSPSIVSIIDITDPTDPNVITTINDGGAYSLNRPRGITTILIDDDTFALVASQSDNAVQIINITDPTKPAATGSIDNTVANTQLNGPFGITTIVIDDKPYALVTSQTSDSVQIINITDPTSPTPTASISDEGDLELNGATGITTMVIGENIYALVASQADDGVQIIDITNPTTPVALSAISDVGGNDIALNDVVDITTILINDRTYALVPSSTDNGVQIIDIGITFQPYILDSVMLALTITVSDSLSITDALPGLDLNQIISSDSLSITDRFNAVIPSTRVTTDFPSITDNISSMISLSLSDSVDPILSITDPSSAYAITNGEDYSLGNANDITTISIGDNTYALVAAFSSKAVQIIDITNPTSPRPTAVIIDNDTLALDGATVITTITINDTLYAIVASQTESGVQIINVTDPTFPTATAAIFHGGDYSLDNPNGISTALINDRTYALVTSTSGVQIIDITSPARPDPVYTITDGTDFPELGDVRGITTISVGTSTYALVTSENESGVQIIDITNPARPVTTANLIDNATLALDNPEGITTVTLGDNTFALVASGGNDGIQIINVTDPTMPNATAAIFDNATLALDGANAISAVTIRDRTYALVASGSDDGVQIIDITDPTYPAPIAAIFDGEDFTTLDGAFGITTMIIGNNVYALVASVTDSGVQIIDTGISLTPQVSDTISTSQPPIITSDSLSITDNAIEMDTLPIIASDSFDTFTLITNPSAVSAIFDNSTLTLLQSRDIATVLINDTTYALVASQSDDGVQIINITNPAMPAPIAAITDNSTLELDGAFGITTTLINDKHYALVASTTDDGVQIINITNPAIPVPIATIPDNGTLALDGAGDITTVLINDKHYALVASLSDDGVQIINITNPAMPVATAAIFDNSTLELDGANGITTVTIDGTIYALVASLSDDGVQIINITNPTTPVVTAAIIDNSTLALDGASDITAVTINDKHYALVASITDDGVQIIDITNPAMPVPIATVIDNDTLALSNAFEITAVTVGANTFALVAAQNDDGVQIIDVTDPAFPTPVSAIFDGSLTALDAPTSVTTVNIDNKIYALVTALSEGVQIIDIGISLQPYVFDSTVLYSSITVSDSLSITDNTIEMDALPIITSDSVGDTVLSITNSSAVSAIFDNSTLALDGASGITAVTINDTPYALVASSDDDGVQIINITNPAMPAPIAAITDNSTLALGGATDITTVTINNNTYALVASSSDKGVQIINITNPAMPAPIAAISDNRTLALNGATDITTTVIDNNTYALVASPFDHGVQIINITDPTTPVATAAIFDGRNGFDTLLAAYGITTVTINDKHYALATSQFDNGVQIINITDPTTPVATANIINNDTLALSSPREITTILIDDNTYALVASFGKGVQIIDITDPSTPVATTALFDGVDYPTLGGATAITTITISDNTFAIVASSDDNGVQIIDVTNPASPTPVSAITDDGDNTALLSAVGVTTVAIDNKHYALVASQTDDGIQIIDIGITIQSQISDSAVLSPVTPQPPITTSDSIDTFAVTSTPSSVSNLTDGRGGFSVLDGPSRVTTVTLGDNTYALVTASDEDNGIQIIDITDPTTPVATHALFDGPDFPTLGGASGIATATIGNSIYALVASVDDAGIQIIDITNSTDPTRLATSPTSISNITNNKNGFDELAGVSSITTVKIGDGTYALALSSSDASITIIDITDPTAPTESFAITDKTTFPALNNPVGIATISINDNTFALVTSSLRDLVQIINITTPTDPTSTFIITNTGDYSLDGASGITTVLINDTSYALVTSQVDDGVQIIDITDPANPDPIVAITNGAEYLLDRPSRITTVTVGTITYALVISINSDGIQIIDITNPASPAPVYDRIYGSSTETPATNSLDITATIIDGTAYAIATSFNDDSIQIIDVGISFQPQISDSAVLSLVTPQPPITTSDSVGALIIITDPTPASSIIDNSTLTLDDSRNIATVTIDDTLYALVTSLANDGVQIIDISNPATPVVTAAITDNSTLALDGAIDITIVTINDDIFALVASLADNGVQIINITNPANPDLTASIVDNSTLALDGTIGITTKVINNDTFALVASRDDNGVQIINITDPTTPTPIAAITDNSTLALGGAFDITTVTINDKHYALTASRTDNGVQIINISNPTTPVVTAAITDNSTLALAGARGITTISINENTYALVASGGDDGVQIINITNPAMPSAFDPIYDGTIYPELLTPSDITAVSIGANTYALVASGGDDGVQIIDITNPAMPAPIANITDGNTFPTLDGANGITTVTIDGTIYALVASSNDDGIQIIDTGITIQPYIFDSAVLSLVIPQPPITTSDSIDTFTLITNSSAVSAIFDNSTLALDRAFGITPIVIDDNTYALVASFSDNGVQIINITDPTMPVATANIVDNRTLALAGAFGITTVTIDDDTFALVASFSNGVQIINITNPAIPVATASIVDNSTLALAGAYNIATATIDGTIYALVAARSDNGVQIINITNPAIPVATANIVDNGTLALASAYDIATVTVGTNTFALVTSQFDNGVQIINITNPAMPTPVSAIFDDEEESISLSSPSGITTVTVDNNTYALVASSNDDGVQIIDITDLTTPVAIASIFDNATLALDDPMGITTVTVGANTFALVASGADDGVQIIDITNPASPTPVSHITDDGDNTALVGARDISTAIINGTIYALVAAPSDDGIQIIDIGIALQSQISDSAVITPVTPQPPIITSDSLSITDNAIEMDTLPIIASDSFDTFTLITNPSAVSAIFDNSTLTLLQSRDIATVLINDTTYALVASQSDDGVQIINITNPAMPAPIAAITDNSTLELDGAFGITTTLINDKHYALVASTTDDGVQIINITNPAIPVPIATIPDNGTLALDGAGDITTVLINDKHYALVASLSDDGVQIINITNPAMPVATAAIFDNSTLELDGANGITTVTIDGTIYALVASLSDDGVQIINITNPTTPVVTAAIIDNSTLALDGASDITAVTINDKHYALVASLSDSGVQIIDITNPAMPVPIATVIDNDTLALSNAFEITAVTVGANTFALVAAQNDDGVQIIDVTDPAFPTPVSAIFDGSLTALDAPTSVTTVNIDNKIYALVTALSEGVQIIDIGISLQSQISDSTVLYSSITVSDSLSITDNTIKMDIFPITTSDSVGDTVLSITNSSAVSAIFDNSILELDGASGITTVLINDTSYALVASSNDDGIQIIDITDLTTPVAIASITDNSTLALDGATDITTVTINDNTYALVASSNDDGVQIIDITDLTTPVAIATITDNSTLALGGATDITTTVIDNNTYALVASSDDSGVQIIDITDPVHPVATAAIFDGRNGFDTLLVAYGITTVTINDKHYALVTSQFDNGVQIINITDPTTPVATANIINNDTLALSVPREITTILIDDNTYALVASFGKGVQIINITDPSTPVATAALFDGVDYPTLGGATAITTITISDNTFAIVTAQNDNGVQIINVTNPASPTPVSAITDDGDNTALLSAVGVTTVVIDNKHYALVASSDDDGIQIIDIGITIQSQISDSAVLSPVTPQPPITTSDSIDATFTSTPSSVSNITDGRGGFSVLDGPSRVTTVTLGDNTFALVTASDEDNGIQIIDITDPATPVATHALFDGPDFPTLGGASGIATATIGNSIYALVASVDDAGIQIIDITNNTDPTRLATSPISISNITNNKNGFDELAGVSSITTVKIGDGTYALALSSSDASITIIDITDPTAPTESFAITDKTTFPALNNPVGIATISINDNTFALVTSSLRDLVQIINITTPTDPTSTFIITNTGDYSLDGASGITTVLINDTSYALVTSQVDDGVQIIDITDPANPDPIVAITNGAEYLLDRPSRITTVTVGTITYALVISINSDGIQIIDITNPASPAPVYDRIYGSSTETPATNSLDITATIIDGTAYAIATSFNDDSIQIIDVGISFQPQISDSAVLSLVTPQPPITTSDSVGALIIITDPTPASSIIDNSTLTLDDSRNIATVTIDDTLYALVTSLANDGVQIINISNPTTPVVTAAITDNSTLALDGAIDITIVTINDDIFALVASLADNGVQIINITNPANPDLTASIVDNSTLALDGTIGITTKVINNDTFALVAARDDNGVQIINITDPTTPAPIAAITDNSTLALGGAFDITTVTINDKHYALTASRTDNGVQIINISNPTTPVVTAAITDNSTLALAGARGITTISINENTYALVASGGDDGVQIINITNPAIPVALAPIYDGTIYPELLTPSDITAVSIGANTYALVASGGDDGVQIIDITNPAMPAPIANISDGNTFPTLDGANGITTILINGTIYALVASSNDDGIQIIDTGITLQPQISDLVVLDPNLPIFHSLSTSDSLSITDDESLATLDPVILSDSVGNAALSITDPSPVSILSNNATLELDGASGITTVTIDGIPYALVASSNDDGVQIIDITDPVHPVAIANLTDTANLELDGATDITTISIDDNTYALVASSADKGVQIINITNPAIPTPIAAITDNSTLALSGANDITTVLINDKPYALVASNFDNGVQIIDITDPVHPVATAAIFDGRNGFDALFTANSITTVTIGDDTFALVAANFANGVQIINITNPLLPSATASIFHIVGDTLLDGPRDITTVSIGNNTYALVASSVVGSVQIINITDPTTPIGTANIVDDRILALDSIRDITTVSIGNNIYALVASFKDDGVQIIDITDPTDLVPVAAITNNGNNTALDAAHSITTILIDDKHYALVAAQNSDAVQIIDIGITFQPYIFDSANVFISTTSVTDSPSITETITTVISGTQSPIITSDSLSITDTITGMGQLTTSDSLGGAILSITDPSHVSAISDDDSTELVGASGVTTIHIGENTYALVASITDDGVTIIDITDPVAPDAIAILSNGVGDYTGLDGAFEVDTITINDTHYALVASFNDSSVTIINITTPADPRFVSAIFDGVDFPELGGAADVVTIFINDTPYALVASTNDNSVIILDLTDPTNPVEADRIVDGVGDFDKLRDASSISTITIGSKIYALVAASVSNSVTIIDITDPTDIRFTASVSDGSDYSLFIPVDITSVLINDKAFAIVASEESGVQIINITNPLLPNATATIIDDDDNTALASPARITTASIGENTYALVTSAVDDGVQIIDITNPARPTPVSFIIDNSEERELDNARGITTVTIDGTLYVLVAAFLDNGVQIIDIGITFQPYIFDSVVLDPTISISNSLTTSDSIGSPIFSITNPSPVSTITRGDTFQAFDGPFGITTVTIGDTTYALVASQDNNAVQIINVTNPADPRFTAAIFEGQDYPKLDGPFDITTVTINNRIYALVTTVLDSSVTIIDITEPTMPNRITIISDGEGEFTELGGVNGITTVTMGTDTYALVASSSDSSVTIIDITIPTNPDVTATIVDNLTLALDGATDITTVLINDDIFALVTSNSDSGLQIINITTPAIPVATAAIIDNDTLALDGASGITAVTINDKHYALVASSDDDGVQIIDISNPTIPVATATIIDNDTLALDGAFGITTVSISNNTYALVASVNDDGVTIIDITDPVHPTPVHTISNGAGYSLDAPHEITTITVGNTTYALVTAQNSDAVQIIDIGIAIQPYTFDTAIVTPNIRVSDSLSITDDAIEMDTLPIIVSDSFGDTVLSVTNSSFVSAISDNSTLALHAPRAIATVLINDKHYALVASQFDDGVQIIDVTDPVHPVAIANLTDTDYTDLELDGAFDIITTLINDKHYALVASQTDDGVQIINITNPAIPTPIAAISDNGTLALFGASGITAVTINDKHYALVASQTDDGVQIINITNPAIPDPISNLINNDTLALDSARAITTILINDKHYALVASYDDDGIQIINITNPVTPVATSSIVDNGTSTALDGAADITAVTINDKHYALVASYVDDGIQIINITNPAMPVATASITYSDGIDLELLGAFGITAVTLGDNTFALVAAFDDNGIQIINITNPAFPTPVSSLSDVGAATALDNAIDVTTVNIDNKIYALVAAFSGGVQIIDTGITFQPYVFDSAVLGQSISVSDSLSITETITTVITGAQSPIIISDSLSITDTITGMSQLDLSDSLSITDTITDMSQLDLSDSLSITDSIADMNQLHLTSSDSLSITETITTVISGAQSPIVTSDSLSITDSITDMSQQHLTISDSISITDTITGMSQLDLSDSLSITDSIADMNQLHLTPSDSLSITDTIATVISAAQSSIVTSDSLSITDTIIHAISGTQLPIVTSDSLSITDSITDMSQQHLTISDFLSVTDVINISQYSLSISDSLSVTDSIADMNQLHLTPSDSLSVTDSIADMNQLHLTPSDSLSVTDSIADMSQFYLTISDSLSVTDTFTKMRHAPLISSDSLSVTDSITSMSQFYLTISDSLSVTDVITGMSQFYLTISDSLSITDTINISQYSLSISDSLSVTDSISYMRQYNISSFDSLSVTDNITGMSQLHLTPSDSLSITDSITDMSQQHLTISDSLSVTDIITGMRQLDPSDSLSITDSITGMSQQHLTISDSLSITDSITDMSQQHLTISDSLSITDILNMSKIQRVITITDLDSPLSEISYSASSVNATLDYSGLSGFVPTTGNNELTTNMNITVTSSDIAGGDVILLLQPSTTINGTGFNGMINLPDDLGIPCTVGFGAISGTPVSCVSVGQDNTVLSLNSSARILLSDQARNIPWVAQNSTAQAVQITKVCDGDDVDTVNDQLSSNDQCHINVENDLVIWTNHFTVYGSNAIVRSGGSSGESTPPSFTTSFDQGTSTISIGETDIAPEPFVIDHTLNDPVLVYTGESIPISLTMYENISWESIAHVEICLNKQISNNQICDSDTKIIWDKNTDDLEIINPHNIIDTASLDITEINPNVATWNYDITFGTIMNPSDMQIYAWDNKRNALVFTVENAINVVLGAAGSTATGDTNDTSGGISSDTTNNPPRTASCSAGELLLNDDTCMDPEPGTFTCSDGEVMVYDGTCTVVTTKDNAILDSDVSLDSQSDIIKRWAGYSELSATDYELTSSLGIETDSDVYLPKWIKSYLGEMTIKNHITADQLKSVVAYMVEISK